MPSARANRDGGTKEDCSIPPPSYSLALGGVGLICRDPWKETVEAQLLLRLPYAMENASYSRVRLETAPYSTKLGIGEFAEGNCCAEPLFPHCTPVCSPTCSRCPVPMCNTGRLEPRVVFQSLLSPTHDLLSFLPFLFASATSPGILSAVYVVGLVVCLLIGFLSGPDVFEKSPPSAVETNTLNVTWYGAVNGMERYHQVNTGDVIKQCHDKLGVPLHAVHNLTHKMDELFVCCI